MPLSAHSQYFPVWLHIDKVIRVFAVDSLVATCTALALFSFRPHHLRDSSLPTSPPSLQPMYMRGSHVCGIMPVKPVNMTATCVISLNWSTSGWAGIIVALTTDRVLACGWIWVCSGAILGWDASAALVRGAMRSVFPRRRIPM